MREIANKQESGAQNNRKFYIAEFNWTRTDLLKLNRIEEGDEHVNQGDDLC